MATIKDKLSEAAAKGREKMVGAMQSLRGAPVTAGGPAPAAPAIPSTASVAPAVSDTPAFQRPDVMERVEARRSQGTTPFRPAPFDPGAGRAGPRPVMDLATPEMKGLRTPAVSAGSRVVGAARAVGGMPGLVGGAALAGGMAAGSKAVESIYGDVIDRAYGTTRNQVNQPLVDEIAAQNPNGKLATFLAGGNPNQATAAPVQTGNMENVFGPGPGDTAGFVEDAATSRRIFGPEAQRLAEGIRSGAISIPTERGTGAVVASDGSGGTVFERGGAGGGGSQGRPRLTPREVALQTLTNEASADFGDPLVGRRGRRDAADAILDFEAAQDNTAATRAATAATSGKAVAELDDKRVKEFNEQFVNNQFSLQNVDKNGKVTQSPDIERNARFLDFARQTDPRFGSPEGILQLSKLSAQDRSKLVSDIRKRFVEKEQVEKVTNEGAFMKFDKPGLSNAPVQVAGAREATVGDIPDIGLGNYIYSNLPFTNRDVVDTDRGALLAEDYIGDETIEGGLDRRRRIYGSK
jgi:hypothetical protein